MDEAVIYRKLGKMEMLYRSKEYERCEKILSELIAANRTTEQEEFKLLFLEKRAKVYYKLERYDLVIQDIATLRQMGSTISWEDELFHMEQEAILNVAISQVINNLQGSSCESNLSFIESRIQMLNSIIPKGIFNKTSNDCVKYAKQTKTLYKLLINV